MLPDTLAALAALPPLAAASRLGAPAAPHARESHQRSIVPGPGIAGLAQCSVPRTFLAHPSACASWRSCLRVRCTAGALRVLSDLGATLTRRYVLVITTVISIEGKNQEADFMKLTACGGVADFNKQHDAATTGRMWGSTEIKATFTKCLSTGPCSKHTSDTVKANMVTGCLLTGTITKMGKEPFILNYVLFAVIIPVCEYPGSCNAPRL